MPVLKSVQITNFKSIDRLDIGLGRVNVFIGENGAGKSNILEAIGLAAAAQADKLDDEFLVSRGIRPSPAESIKSRFKTGNDRPVEIVVVGRNGVSTTYEIDHSDEPYGTWSKNISSDMTKAKNLTEDFNTRFERTVSALSKERQVEFVSGLRALFSAALDATGEADDDETTKLDPSTQPSFPPEFASLVKDLFPSVDDNLKDFVIYSPENSSLRIFEREGQIQPLGVNGEGLLKLLNVMSENSSNGQLNRVKQALSMLDWFFDFSIVEDDTRAKVEIRDRYLQEGQWSFDQRSANEGFLFIAFYFSLFSSDLTPNIFGIDNIDASLNPKLCRAMMEQITSLAESNNKQVILTTHNPAILDGLDLHDDEQRLFIIHRNRKGHTKATRYAKPLPEGYPKRLSEMFMSGLIGGLPKGF